MRPAAVLMAAALLALPAHADIHYDLAMQVSYDGFLWGSSVAIDPGTPVYCRMAVSFGLTQGSGAWASLSLSQIDVINSWPGDVISNLSGKLMPSTQTFALLDSGAPGARIDRADNSSFNISLGQLPVANGGSTDNPIVVLKWTYTPALEGDPIRDLVLDAPLDNIKGAHLFGEGGGSMAIDPAFRTSTPAIIHITPAPATLVSLAAILAAPRRRRQI